MFKLPKALSAWNTDAFEQTLKIEIRNLGIDSLPLSHGLDMGGYVDNGHITIMVLRAVDAGVAIQCKVGIFFTEVVPCCGCPIEPMETGTGGGFHWNTRLFARFCLCHQDTSQELPWVE